MMHGLGEFTVYDLFCICDFCRVISIFESKKSVRKQLLFKAPQTLACC